MTEKENKYIGFCIYCRSKKLLSDEHIIPFALSGKFTLSSASCEKCRRITNSFEAPVLRGLFYDYRFFKGHWSRSKFKDFNPLREYVVKTKDGRIEKRELHLNQVGLHFFLPEFEQPKFLTGDDSPGVKLTSRVPHFFAKPKSHNVPPDLDSVKIKRDIPTGHLIRFLCKACLGYVYLRSMEKNFESNVTNLILGKTGAEDWRYVGSPSSSRFKDNEKGIELFRQGDLLLSEIKLFDDVTARYLVVLGRI